MNFSEKKYKLIGIEPTDSHKIAKQKGLVSLNSFFNYSVVKKIKHLFGKPKIIFATNV